MTIHDSNGFLKLIERRQEFLAALGRLKDHVQQRLQVIMAHLEETARKSPGKTKLYETVWEPRLKRCADRVRRFGRRCQLRPTLCMMGKRGQGKTTLLHKWLGESDARPGLPEIRKLPTGNFDTTAALVRLIGVGANEKLLDTKYLYVDLLTRDDLPNVTERPPDMAITEFKVLREVSDPDVDPLAPYWLCRFPVDGKDNRLRLLWRNDHYVLSCDGTEPLDVAQWRTRQVKIPVCVDGGRSRSDAVRVLGVVDVIDAPGADSMEQGHLREWKREKNSYVFRTAIQELDLLMVVCSSNAAAIQLGGQFQREIWYPWLDRCRDERRGRLILAFTKAADFLAEAAERMEQEASGRVGNEERSFARKIWKNVLDPLSTPGPESPSLIAPADPDTWPPIFFFDSSEGDLDKFAFPAGVTSDDMAGRLCSLLDKEQGDTPDQLPLGAKCVLQLVRDWDPREMPRFSKDEIRVVQHWIVQAFCRLLDPADRGFGLLTDFVINYASSGPVARNHAIERKREADGIVQEFHDLLRDFAKPAGGEEAVRELQLAHEAAEKLWGKHPGGPQLRVGENCSRRWEDARTNADVLHRNERLFVFGDALQDVVNDGLDAVLSNECDWTPQQTEAVRRAVAQCLQSDRAIRAFVEKNRPVLHQSKAVLVQFQVIALERMIRILDYLKQASTNDLKLVAQHCYQTNVEEGELIAAVLKKGLTDKSCEDQQAAEDVSTCWKELMKAIDVLGFANPFLTSSEQEKPCVHET